MGWAAAARLATAGARARQVSVGTAVPFAASQAAIEYATERIPVGACSATCRRLPFSTLWRQAAAEVLGEQVATVLQDLNEAVLNREAVLCLPGRAASAAAPRR